ncbi:hypothetical protein [Streptomyces sp. NPDC046751]|uniref:hypothetical protein n=1 Tax=unclassified Streptomyces TaxID=2593676 RepID=UPI0033FD7F1E
MSELYVVRQKLIGVEHLEVDEREEDEHAKLAYATYGAAVYFANVLEANLIGVLATAEVVEAREAGQTIPDDPWDRRRQSKKTMGYWLKEVKRDKHLTGKPELESNLDRALDRRNHLAHHFWHDRIEDVFSSAGRNKLINELEGDRGMFDKTNQNLTTMVLDPLIRKAGVSPEQEAAVYDLMLRQAEARDG